MVQTYNPDHFSIEYAKKQDYDLFYNAEISLRKKLKYPPFCDIIVMWISSKIEQDAKKIAKKWYEFLNSKCKNDYMTYQPMPAPISKIKNKYRYRIIVKCSFNSHMIDILNEGEKHIEKNKNIRVLVDVNPSNMM